MPCHKQCDLAHEDLSIKSWRPALEVIFEKCSLHFSKITWQLGLDLHATRRSGSFSVFLVVNLEVIPVFG